MTERLCRYAPPPSSSTPLRQANIGVGIRTGSSIATLAIRLQQPITSPDASDRYGASVMALTTMMTSAAAIAADATVAVAASSVAHGAEIPDVTRSSQASRRERMNGGWAVISALTAM